MLKEEMWQVKTSRRGDSWGDVGVLRVCGVMGVFKICRSKRSGK